MKYSIPKNTYGKLVVLKKNYDAKVEDWQATKHLEFISCIISPLDIKNNILPETASLAHRMAKEGYILFGGEHGNSSDACYIIAVKYDEVVIND